MSTYIDELRACSESQLEAMDAMIMLCEAIHDNNLTTRDIESVVRLAVEDREDCRDTMQIMQICLMMAAEAIRRAKE